MNANKTRSKGLSSVIVAAIFAIGLILLIAFIAISMPLAKSNIDKTYWSGQMGIYKPPNPINATNGQPAFNGYCLVNTVDNVTYTTCPSTVMNSTTTGNKASLSPPGNPVTYITITVNDPQGAGWLVTWSGSTSGSQSGSGSNTWQVSTNGAINLEASITNNPQGYTCTINPSSTTANPGSTVTFNINCQAQAGSISVSVTNDTLGAAWQVSWTDAQGLVSSSQSGSSDYSWTINNVPSGDVVAFSASITNNPSGYQCSITPQSTTAQEGQSVTFTVSCVSTAPVTPPMGKITVTVNDSYGASWQVTWNDAQGVVSGSKTGSSTYTWVIPSVPSTDTVYFSASITSSPPDYICSIAPATTSAKAGQSITFTVACQAMTGSINVAVTGDTYGATWKVSWHDSMGVVNGSQSGSINQSWQISNVPYGDIVYLSAQITNNPPGYSCTISPGSTAATAGNTVTFTVQCTITSGVYLVVKDNSPGVATWLLSITAGKQLYTKSGSDSASIFITAPSGTNVVVFSSIASISNGYTCSISPQTTSAVASQPPPTLTFTMSCTYDPGSASNGVQVVVFDPYGADWQITWVLNGVSNTKTGSSTTTFTIYNVPSGASVFLTAAITGWPWWQYSWCSITPSQIWAGAGTLISFTVTCKTWSWRL